MKELISIIFVLDTLVQPKTCPEYRNYFNKHVSLTCPTKNFIPFAFCCGVHNFHNFIHIVHSNVLLKVQCPVISI